MQELGLEHSKEVKTPGVKESRKDSAEEHELSKDQASMYRRLVARLNYLAQDRSDIGYATKELCRKMSKPTEKDWIALKRIGRYLKGRTRVVTTMGYDGGGEGIVVWTDTDYAGCQRTRKSTSGGVVTIGGRLIKTWSNSQGVIALSSGEAEFYGIVKGAGIAIGLQNMLEDFDVAMKIEVRTDASAAKGIANRRGLGKVRHMEVSQLWVQEKVSSGRIAIVKVKGENNIADALTKHVDQDNIGRHLIGTRQRIAEGRHELAPTTASEA